MTEQAQNHNFGVLPESIAGQVKPYVEQYDQVEVKLNVQNVVANGFTEIMFAQFEAELMDRELPFTKEQLLNYFEDALEARIAISTQRRLRKANVWQKGTKFRIPAFLNIALVHVGKCEDPDLGLVLIPEVSRESEPLDYVTTSKISTVLTSLENRGFEMAQSVPRAPEGDLHTMSMFVAEDMATLGMNQSSTGVQALVSAFFQTTGLEAVIGKSAFRVTYLAPGEATRHWSALAGAGR